MGESFRAHVCKSRWPLTSRVQLVDNMNEAFSSSCQQSKPKHRRLLSLKLARKTKNGDKENEVNFANRESSVNESLQFLA